MAFDVQVTFDVATTRAWSPRFWAAALGYELSCTAGRV